MNRKARIRVCGTGVVVVLVLASGAAACRRETAPDTGRISVAASVYPLAEAARRVGGDRVEVVDLTPAGAEPHDLEPTPRQVDEIADADVMVVVGGGFQPAVEEVASRRDGVTVTALDLLSLGRDVDSDGRDPHVWLDPVFMSDIVEQLAAALAKADPAGRGVYRANAIVYRAELETLDRQFATGLARCERDLLITAHESFGRLARRYGLREEGIGGRAPDTEPDPRRLADLADLARAEGVTTIFTEALVAPDVAATLAREAGGLQTAVLDPLEGKSLERQAAGDDYLAVMRADLAALRRALGCT